MPKSCRLKCGEFKDGNFKPLITKIHEERRYLDLFYATVVGAVTPVASTPKYSVRYARFTLADPMPRLGSDVVGGNSGRNHPTSRRHTIHIGRMARNVSIRVGWYEGVVQYDSLVGTVKESYLSSRWPPDEAPTAADSVSGDHSHWPSRQHRGTIGASDRLM